MKDLFDKNFKSSKKEIEEDARATVIKTAWYWHKNRDVDQRNQIEDLDINSHICEHLIFDNKAKIKQWN